MKISNPSRLLALLTAGVLSAGVMLHPAPARADKAKTYKYGAIALGAVGAYMLSKGKTVEGAALLGAGAYAYKKGEDTRKAEPYGNYRDRYGYRSNNGNRYGNSYNQGYYNVPPSNRLSDRDRNSDSSYRAYRYDDRYASGYGNDDSYINDNGYDNSYNNGYNYDNSYNSYNDLHPKIR